MSDISSVKSANSFQKECLNYAFDLALKSDLQSFKHGSIILQGEKDSI
jgi:hypothetical protein